MSYILDALRRDDSERERGAVPGVHAQPVPLGSAHTARPPAPRTWVWVSVALATLLVALLAWQLMGRDAAPEAAPPPPSDAVPLPVVTAPAPTPVAVTEPASLPAPGPAPVPVTAPVAARPRNAAPTPAKTVATAPAGSRAAAAVVPAASAVAAGSTARIPTANELPEDIQRGLPTLVVGGASYSQNAENRMLIVNGQVLREGDKVAPEVTLEQIRLKEAVLSTKGHRYRIVY